MIKKIKMASNQFWHIGEFFFLNLLGVRESSPPIFSLFSSCWSSSTVSSLCNRWCPGNVFTCELLNLNFVVFSDHTSNYHIHTCIFWKKRETGCIFFLEPDVFGIVMLHFKISKVSTTWKQQVFHHLELMTFTETVDLICRSQVTSHTVW